MNPSNRRADLFGISACLGVLVLTVSPGQAPMASYEVSFSGLRVPYSETVVNYNEGDERARDITRWSVTAWRENGCIRS